MVAITQSFSKETQHILIRQLANCIQENWANYFTLEPYEIPKDLGYIESSLEGEKLTIKNKCYQTVGLRKLHLELARIGDRLDILHCVMFPRTNYPLPIFGVDLVGTKDGIGAAIVDLSPMNRQRVLSNNYQNALASLPEINFSHPRNLPEWGDIFSQHCLFVRLTNSKEEQLFLDRVNDILNLHCKIANSTPAVFSKAQETEILQAQYYYCIKQQQNDKTKKVLEKYLGEAWSERYMTTMLFDLPYVEQTD